MDELELAACQPEEALAEYFNPNAEIPYGLTVDHVRAAMNDFLDFLGFMNTQLNGKSIQRLETMLMPANFSSMVGEFVGAAIPKHCNTLVRNTFHNGHPDVLPANTFENDSVQYGDDGIEIKASRYLKGWQGHNAEDAWLMVFCFEANRQKDESEGKPPIPFRFLKVCGAQLSADDDWRFSGRSKMSRRTITASVTASGYEKMMANWIYLVPELQVQGDLL